MAWWGWLVLFIIAFSTFSYYSNKKRREFLMAKYQDAKLVEKLMSKQIWQGQTEEQLLDSLGRPRDIDQNVLKTKVKKTWKYNETGKNRYALKVIIENGQVVGWDKK